MRLDKVRKTLQLINRMNPLMRKSTNWKLPTSNSTMAISKRTRMSQAASMVRRRNLVLASRIQSNKILNLKKNKLKKYLVKERQHSLNQSSPEKLLGNLVVMISKKDLMILTMMAMSKRKIKRKTQQQMVNVNSSVLAQQPKTLKIKKRKKKKLRSVFQQ